MTDYRPLAELPAFIEEAFGNVSLSAVIAAYQDDDALALIRAMNQAVYRYAEEWVSDHVINRRGGCYDDEEAIAYGVSVFSEPSPSVGLPMRKAA